LHRLRALVDAVVVGVTTAALDDPRLNVRHVEGPTPARVIIDPSGRLSNTSHCLANDGARRIVIQKVNTARPQGVEVVQLPADEAHGIRPTAILLIEGGAFTLSRFIAAGCIHRLHVMVAPLIIGSGTTGISLPPIKRLEEARRPRMQTYEMPGGEMLFDCEMNT
jgi:diaminohydroxyphosphoribosylaminopyrimidine deaminase/5-amino-6-(5-phosphoribosylamino)uracil reductase